MGRFGSPCAVSHRYGAVATAVLTLMAVARGIEVEVGVFPDAISVPGVVQLDYQVR